VGANRLSLSHRLGIILVILGMMQSLMPTCFRSTRPSLRVAGGLKIALDLIDIADVPASQAIAGPTLASVAGQDQESDQESQSAEDLAETFALAEAIPVRRTVQRFASIASLRLAPMPGRDSTRTQSALHRSRSGAILASLSAGITARLCRMTC